MLAANITNKVTSMQEVTVLGVYPNGKSGQPWPMDVKEIRKRNFQWLVEIHGGPKRFSDILGRSPNLVSQWAAQKSIGHRTARRVEDKLVKPLGWMDKPQWNLPLGDAQGIYLDAALNRVHLRAAVIVVERRRPVSCPPEDIASAILEAYDLLQIKANEQVVARAVDTIIRRVGTQPNNAR